MHFIHELLKKEFCDELFAILLKGSVHHGEQDYWSDTDFVVIMDEGRSVDMRIREAVARQGKILGEELHDSEEGIVYRWVLEYMGDIEMVDLHLVDYHSFINQKIIGLSEYTVLYQKADDELPKQPDDIREYQEFLRREHIEGMWFRLYEATKKICRKDHLIGLHLVLDLVREYLVLDMMRRDVKKQTHIHSHGDMEELPEAIAVKKIHTKDPLILLDYIDQLAKHLDHRFLLVADGYESRYDRFHEHIRDSVHHLSYS